MRLMNDAWYQLGPRCSCAAGSTPGITCSRQGAPSSRRLRIPRRSARDVADLCDEVSVICMGTGCKRQLHAEEHAARERLYKQQQCNAAGHQPPQCRCRARQQGTTSAAAAAPTCRLATGFGAARQPCYAAGAMCQAARRRTQLNPRRWLAQWRRLLLLLLVMDVPVVRGSAPRCCGWRHRWPRVSAR